MNAVFLLIGIGLLGAGGEVLIRGALSTARMLRVSPLLAGLVIVGFGTSMPELVVSFDAARSGHSAIAVGNVVGSNIANLLLILGLCAVITPLAVTAVALRRDAVTVIAATLVCIGLANDGVLSAIDGALLLGALLAYLTWAYLSERTGAVPSAAVHEAEAAEVHVLPRSAAWTLMAVGGGLALLIVGSRILLKGAIGIAHDLGVSQAVVGLTLVAVGTSLPELTISVVAALRRHADVAVGNILGSNIFNLLGILGISALVQPLDVSGRIADFDRWIMLAAALLLVVFLLVGRRLNRVEGGVLLLGYVAYVGVSYAAMGA